MFAQLTDQGRAPAQTFSQVERHPHLRAKRAKILQRSTSILLRSTSILQRYKFRWSAIKFSRASISNQKKHLKQGWAGSVFSCQMPDIRPVILHAFPDIPDNPAFSCRTPDVRPDNSAVPNIRPIPPLKQGFYFLTSAAYIK